MPPLLPPYQYTLGRCLHASARSEVYAAVRTDDGREVVLKRYASEPHAQGCSATREFHALRAVQGSGIPEPIELVVGADSPVLVLARAPGILLSDWVAAGLPTSASFLAVAAQLADVLARVHEAQLIHRGVQPNNMLVDPQTLQTHLIDFGLARALGATSKREAQQDARALRYVAPEQTGRMGRGIDSRSDLYSLGASFYFALTGQAPFESNDPLALVHAHIARAAAPLVERRPGLPATLSRIVLKLLQKEPDDRYQTARALLRDLLECQEQLTRTGQIDEHFRLGTADTASRPLFGRKLYGRSAESAALQAAYMRASAGRAELVLLTGPPGAGKSALLQELRCPLAESGGYLASAKFDLYRRNVPYAGLAAALGSLTQQMLTETEQRLVHWRQLLLESLGSSAAALLDLIPDLGIILGELPQVPTLGARETQARIALGAQRLLQACARPEHPLVLFLDDAHCADPGSRDLLGELLPRSQSCALLVVVTYRDNEVNESHPFGTLLTRLEGGRFPMTRISVGPLADEACAQMLADAFGRPLSEVNSLAERIARKTERSPLLLQQFVLHLHGLGLIQFNSDSAWTWDDAAIAAADIPEGAIALMVAKLQRLEARARELIQFASCVGDEFDIELLGELSGLSHETLEPSLFLLAQQGLIAPSAFGFRFVHDRIREAAQALLSSEERSALHHRTARLLLERTPEGDWTERAFEIADHLNRALERLSEVEREEARGVNLVAGRRALASGDAAAASSYLACARALFGGSDWEREPDRAFTLFERSAEAAFQARDFDLCLRMLDVLEPRPLASIQRVQIIALRIRTLSLIREDEALQLTIAALRAYRVRWRRNPSQLRVRLEILWTDWLLRGPLDESQFTHRGSQDVSWVEPLLIIAAGGGVMMRCSIGLLSLATAYALRRYRRYGAVRGPGYALAGYAMCRIGVLRNLRGADHYARAAEAWMARAPNPLNDIRGAFVLQSFIYSWLEPRGAVQERLWRTSEQAREIGDLEYCDWAALVHVSNLLLSGERLERALHRLEILCQHELASDWTFPEVLRRAYGFLRDTGVAGIDWARELAAADARTADRTITGMYMRVHWIGVLCFFGEYALASARAEAVADALFNGGPPGVYLSDYVLYRAVSRAALADAGLARERKAHARAVGKCLGQLKTWACLAPEVVHMAQLVEAEYARARNDSARALQLYPRAAQRAREHGFRHHAALAHERCADLLRRLRRRTEAKAETLLAIQLYREWGAQVKVRQLEEADRNFYVQIGRGAAGGGEVNPRGRIYAYLRRLL